jgi:cephalosporin hydroxylase
MPNEFKFLEIGVFRGQVLSLYRLLADMSGKKAVRYGVSPMDSSDGHWDSDYFADAVTIHQQFNLKKDYTIYHGSSTDKNIIEKAQSTTPYDILYIDGGHTFDIVQSDLASYPQMIKKGGYLLIDDACNDMNQPWGYFQGIQPVTDAVLEWEKTEIGKEFEFIFNVVHNRLYIKK